MSNAARLETPGSGDDDKLIAYDEGGDAFVLTDAPSVSSLSLGAASGDYLTRGGALTWRDLMGTIAVRGSGAATPTLSQFRAGQVYDFSYDTGDFGFLTLHVPHDYALGTDVWLHPHWAVNATGITSGSQVTFSYYVTYSKSNMYPTPGSGSNAFAAEITMTHDITGLSWASNIGQYWHRVDEFQLSSATGDSGTKLVSGDLEPDGLILIAFNPSTQPSWTGGSGGVFVFELDMHYQTTGITGTPTRYPSFY